MSLPATGRFAGKVIVITGASGGIGAATAERVARDGATVVCVARREAELRAVAARCGPRAHPMVADCPIRGEVHRVVTEVMRAHDHFDVWINNVGRGISRLPTELTDADLDAMFTVNVRSAIYGMQEALPHFRARGTGHVINISSMLGRMPSSLIRSAYSASKHYLNAITANFRTEVQETHPGIQFTLVSPGIVYTDFGTHALHGGPDSRSLPLGQPVEEVAAVIADVIVSRKPDVYTRPGARQRIVEYVERTGEDP